MVQLIIALVYVNAIIIKTEYRSTNEKCSFNFWHNFNFHLRIKFLFAFESQFYNCFTTPTIKFDRLQLRFKGLMRSSGYVCLKIRVTLKAQQNRDVGFGSERCFSLWFFWCFIAGGGEIVQLCHVTWRSSQFRRDQKSKSRLKNKSPFIKIQWRDHRTRSRHCDCSSSLNSQFIV